MSDLISRQAAIDAVHKEFDECLVWDESGEHTANEVENILYMIPSAQPEIVYCKDCKHYAFPDNSTYAFMICKKWHAVVFDKDFCSRGEREENG